MSGIVTRLFKAIEPFVANKVYETTAEYKFGWGFFPFVFTTMVYGIYLEEQATQDE